MFPRLIINTEFSEYHCLSLIVHAISNKFYYCSLYFSWKKMIVNKTCNKQETNVLKFEKIFCISGILFKHHI